MWIIFYLQLCIRFFGEPCEVADPGAGSPPNINMGKPVIYCNKTVRTWMRIQMTERYNVHFTWDNLAGKKVLSFAEVPVKRCDQILSTESQIAFS